MRAVRVLVLTCALPACDLVSDPGGPKPGDFDGERDLAAAPAPGNPTTTTAPAAPSPTDGLENGDESDVDCGGANAPKCSAGRACSAGADCALGACGTDHRCQATLSCNAEIGAGNHCGPGNADDCCARARVPSTGGAVSYSVAKWGLTTKVSPFTLDKYELTVGRLRAFFEAMDGDPRTNFEKAVGPNAGAHPKVANSGWHPSWTKRLPANWADIHSRYGDPAEANGTQYCMRGAGGEYGTTTWKKNRDTTASLPENFEVKPVVCLDWYTLFAFCAWDGGRLPTTSEWGLAAGDDDGRMYSWGNDAPANQNVVFALQGFVPYPDFTWGAPYRFPFDRGTHVAPVGRKLPGKYGHYDLSGNVAEWLLDAKIPQGTCDDCADIREWKDPLLAWPDYEPTLGARHPSWFDGGVRVLRGGTWEGHDVKNVDGTWDGIEVGFTYHAIGGRCAYDL